MTGQNAHMKVADLYYVRWDSLVFICVLANCHAACGNCSKSVLTAMSDL